MGSRKTTETDANQAIAVGGNANVVALTSARVDQGGPDSVEELVLPSREELLAKLSEGRDVWNAWRKQQKLDPGTLDLRDVDLQGRDLKEYVLDGADLRRANLTGANLSGASLERCLLFETKFRDADLQEARLSSAEGLLVEQLGLTDLRGADLPPDAREFKGLTQADEACKNAGKLLDITVFACVFLTLLLVTTPDLTLLTAGTATLPLVNVPMSLRWFSLEAPVLLFGLAIPFNISLQEYWDRVASLPTFFPDGTPIDRRTQPWIMSNLVRRYNLRLKKEASAFWMLGNFVAWWLVPVTIAVFWWRFLPLREWGFFRDPGTIWHVLVLVVALLWARLTKKLAVLALQGHQEERLRWRRFVSLPEFRVELLRGFALLLVLLSISWCLFAYPGALPIMRPILHLENAELSQRRSDGDRTVIGVNLRERNLRGVSALRAFLPGADLRWADLTDGDLRRADLRGANLRGDARLPGGEPEPDHLHGANLEEADLRGADLRGADLSNVQLRGAWYDGTTHWPLNFELAKAGAQRVAPDAPDLRGLYDPP